MSRCYYLGGVLCPFSCLQYLRYVLKSEKINNILNKFMYVGGVTEGYSWRSLLGDRSSGAMLHYNEK